MRVLSRSCNAGLSIVQTLTAPGLQLGHFRGYSGRTKALVHHIQTSARAAYDGR